MKGTFWTLPSDYKDTKIPKINYKELESKFCEKAELAEVKKPVAAPKIQLIYILEQKKVNNVSIVMGKFPFKPDQIIELVKELSDQLN
jgi:hypothetical protein